MLDIGSTAAEVCAITNAYHKNKRKTFYVSDKMHRYILDILETKCDVLDINLKIQCPKTFQIDDDTCGMMIQYPDTYGDIHIPKRIIADANANKSIVSCATDPISLVKLKPPGEIGADIAFGTSQRLGVPMYYGGPHAAFLSMRENLLRFMPGRLVGISKESQNNECYRLALQSREQHIRKDKAISNICTSQALLANISSMYGIYHGKDGLEDIYSSIKITTNNWRDVLISNGFNVINKYHFDTITIDYENAGLLYEVFLNKGFVPFYDYNEPNILSFSFDETISYEILQAMSKIVHNYVNKDKNNSDSNSDYDFPITSSCIKNNCDLKYKRDTPFLTSSIFENGMS